MHRRLLLLLALIVAMTGSARTEAEIQIGFANPLSGPYALSGHRNQVAVETAVYDLNRRGGVLDEQVHLVTVDDACGLEQALVAARELVTAGVRFVVGHLCSHSSLLAAGVYDAADILMISPDSTHPRLTEEGRGNVFRLIGRDDGQAQMAADLLAERWAEKKIAILHDGTTYGEGLAVEARKRLRQHGVIEALYDAYVPGVKDYSALIDRLQNAGIEILYVGGYGREAGLILRTARERGDRLQLVGGDGLGMDGFWAEAGAAGDGTIFSARPEVRGTAEAADVLTRFQRRGLAPLKVALGPTLRFRPGRRPLNVPARLKRPRWPPCSVAVASRPYSGRLLSIAKGISETLAGSGRYGPTPTTSRSRSAKEIGVVIVRRGTRDARMALTNRLVRCSALMVEFRP
jgi:branched-chain amino acid transport system substrate-binding protein